MEVNRIIKASLDEEAAPIVSVDRDGSHMATANLSGNIALWSGINGRCQLLKGHSKRVLCIEFSPIGDTLCSGSADGSINMWSTATGECMQTLKGHRGGVKSISFDARGRSLGSGSSDGSLRVWRMMDGRCTHVFASPSGANVVKGDTATCVAFNPHYTGDGEGSVMLVGGRRDGSIHTWSPSDQPGRGGAARGGVLLRAMHAHKGKVTTLAYHPNQHDMICSFGDDCTVRVWSLETGKCLQSIDGLAGVLSMSCLPGTGHMLLSCISRGQGGPETASVGDKVKGMAKGAYYFFASGAGGGKIDGLKPRDSGVRLVLISYSEDDLCFKGLLCHALVPGGHADAVSAVGVSPTCEVLSTVSPQKGCMWSVAYKAMTASHASGEEVVITITDGSVPTPEGKMYATLTEGTESTRSHSEWDEEESAGSAPSHRSKDTTSNDGGGGVGFTGGGVGLKDGGTGGALPRFPAGGFGGGGGGGGQGLGTEELANMLLQGTHGQHGDLEEETADADGTLVSASVGWSLKKVEPPRSLTGDKGVPERDRRRAPVVAVPIDEVLMSAGGHMPQAAGGKVQQWSGKANAQGGNPLPKLNKGSGKEVGRV